MESSEHHLSISSALNSINPEECSTNREGYFQFDAWHYIRKCWRSHLFGKNGDQRRGWKYLLFGQFIALIATSQNLISFVIESDLGLVFPMFLMFPAYVILSFHLFANRWLENDPQLRSAALYKVPLIPIKIRSPFLYYVILSLLDVGPNYLTLLSLKHTSLTSVTLLSSLTIPSTMVACRFLLNRKFDSHHYVGVSLCLVGGLTTVMADHNNVDTKTPELPALSNAFFGDVLAIIAALLYGLGDAAGEFWSKNVDRQEYLGMIGLNGTMATIILFPLTEGQAVRDMFVKPDVLPTALCLVSVYVIFLVIYYVSATLFLVSSDATLLNLSLQTSNLWAIVFSIVAFRKPPSPLFYIAFFFVVAGVSIYELLSDREEFEEQTTLQRKNSSIGYQTVSGTNSSDDQS